MPPRMSSSILSVGCPVTRSALERGWRPGGRGRIRSAGRASRPARRAGSSWACARRRGRRCTCPGRGRAWSARSRWSRRTGCAPASCGCAPGNQVRAPIHPVRPVRGRSRRDHEDGFWQQSSAREGVFLRGARDIHPAFDILEDQAGYFLPLGGRRVFVVPVHAGNHTPS